LSRGTQLRCATTGTHGLLDTGEDGLAVGKVLVRDPGTLPGDRPATTLLGNIVGAVPRDQHMSTRTEGQQVVAVLQKNQRLADGLPREPTMFRGPQQLEMPR